jgi:hypothetical protein
MYQQIISLPGTTSLQLDTNGNEWNGGSEAKEAKVQDGVWDLSVVHLEWDVLVDTLLEVDGLLSRGGECSLGGLGELSGEHCLFCFVSVAVMVVRVLQFKSFHLKTSALLPGPQNLLRR